MSSKYDPKYLSDPNDRTGIRTVSLNLLFGVPALAIFSAIQDYYDRYQAFNEHSDVLAAFVFTSICHILIIVFAIDAGSSFWALERTAIRKVKRVLLLYIGYWILVNYAPLFVYLPPEFKDTLRFRILTLTTTVVAFLSWSFHFLNKSKAVHALYGTKEEPEYTPPVA